MSFKHMALFCILLASLSACYKMPTDDDFSTVPTTNNPDVTGSNKSKNSNPGINL